MKALIALAFAANLFADGVGVLARSDLNSWRITILSSPARLQTGQAEIAAVVENQPGLQPVVDASVQFSLRTAGSHGIIVPAIRSSFGNRILYVAHWDAHPAGHWQIVASVTRGDVRVQIPCVVTVDNADSVAAFLPSLAVVPVGVMLIALNRLLRSRRNSRRRVALPKIPAH